MSRQPDVSGKDSWSWAFFPPGWDMSPFHHQSVRREEGEKTALSRHLQPVQIPTGHCKDTTPFIFSRLTDPGCLALENTSRSVACSCRRLVGGLRLRLNGSSFAGEFPLDCFGQFTPLPTPCDMDNEAGQEAAPSLEPDHPAGP